MFVQRPLTFSYGSPPPPRPTPPSGGGAWRCSVRRVSGAKVLWSLLPKSRDLVSRVSVVTRSEGRTGRRVRVWLEGVRSGEVGGGGGGGGGLNTRVCADDMAQERFRRTAPPLGQVRRIVSGPLCF